MPRRKVQSTLSANPPYGYADAPAGARPRRAQAAALLRIGEVAQMLRVGRTTVYYLIRCGDLAAVRVTRLLRVRTQDVARYIRRHPSRYRAPRRPGRPRRARQ